MPQHAIPAEAVMDLRRRLATLPPRSAERRRLMRETAQLYGVSEQTLYRVLRQQGKLRAVTRRMDRGVPRVLPQGDLTRVSVNSFLDTFTAKIRRLVSRVQSVARVGSVWAFCSHAAQSATSHCSAA